MNNVAALTEEGAFALFFGPHPGGFDSSRVPAREFAIQGKKTNANARGSARRGGGGGWAQLELTDALEKHYSFRGPINDRIWHGIDNKLNETFALSHLCE